MSRIATITANLTARSRLNWSRLPIIAAFRRRRARGPIALVTQGQFTPAPTWYWNFWHREEAQRGLDASEDLFFPGSFSAELATRVPMFFIATAESRGAGGGQRGHQVDSKRRQDLGRAPAEKRAGLDSHPGARDPINSSCAGARPAPRPPASLPAIPGLRTGAATP